MNDISIILPAFNEEKSIEILVNKIINSIRKKKYKFNIIIVNDGSKDATLEKCKILKKKYNNVNYINLPKNLGKAYALDKGIRLTSAKWICIMDTDLQYDPKYLNIIFNEKNFNYDFINSKREGRSDNFLNIFFSNIYVFFLRLLFKKKYDYFSGLKFFKKKLYNQLKYKGLVRFLIFYCIKKNYKIKEISIKHKKRIYGDSYKFNQRIYLFLADLLTIFFFIIFNKKQIKTFEKISIFIFAILSLIYVFKFNNFFILLVLLSLILIYRIVKYNIFYDKKK